MVRMRLLSTSALILGLLAGCGGATDRAETVSSSTPEPPTSTPPTSTPTAERFQACSLLDDEQLETLAGTAVGYGRSGDFYHARWTCGHGDDVVAQANVDVTYQAMPASEWAAKAAYVVDTTPSEQKAREPFDAALATAELDEDALQTLGDAAACDFWRTYLLELGLAESEEIAFYGDVLGEDLGQYWVSEFCTDGVYGTVRLRSPHAAEPEGQKRVYVATDEVIANAVAALGTSR